MYLQGEGAPQDYVSAYMWFLMQPRIPRPHQIFAQQRDGDLGPPHLDLPNIGGDHLGVIAGRIVSDVPADRIENNGFDLCRRHAGHRPGGLRLSLDQGGRYVVAVPRSALAAVARAHAVAAVIEDAARQQSFRARPGRAIAIALFSEPSLNGPSNVSRSRIGGCSAGQIWPRAGLW